MTASGESSIRNYECGSPPLIDLYKILDRDRRVLGARFSGAGFRGCCVALVEPVAGRARRPTRSATAYARRHPDLAATPTSCCATPPTAPRSSMDAARVRTSLRTNRHPDQATIMVEPT